MSILRLQRRIPAGGTDCWKLQGGKVEDMQCWKWLEIVMEGARMTNNLTVRSSLYVAGWT